MIDKFKTYYYYLVKQIIRLLFFILHQSMRMSVSTDAE